VIPAVAEREVKTVVETAVAGCGAKDIKEFLIVIGERSDAAYVSFLETLRRETAAAPVRILRQPGRGLGDAVYYGISQASGSHMIVLGADTENDPADVAVMVALAKEQPERIFTAPRRLEKDAFSDYPKFKRFLNDLFCFGLRVLFGSKQTDITYAYQIMPADFVRQVEFSPRHGYNNIMLDLGLMPELYGFPYTEFPSKVGRRKSGKSSSSAKYYIRIIGGVLALFFGKRLRRKKTSDL
jgi:hypothetical protein